MNSISNKLNFLNVLSILALCMMVSCKSDPSIKQTKNETKEPPVELTDSEKIEALAKNAEAVHRIFQTIEFKLLVDYTNETNSQLSLRTEGLKPEVYKYAKLDGTIFNVFLMDLDGDTFNEFVFSIKKNDGTDRSELMAFVSHEGKALKNITVETLPEKVDSGMDVLDFSRNRIVRTFRSNGQVVKYTYALIKEGDQYILRPNKTK